MIGDRVIRPSLLSGSEATQTKAATACSGSLRRFAKVNAAHSPDLAMTKAKFSKNRRDLRVQPLSAFGSI
jgi:hypothetical protein